MPSDLDTTLLRSFTTGVRTGSISRAAAVLGHTQPALSQQVRRLERTVGQPLLRRTPSGVTLTRAGEILLPYAERILALSAQATRSSTPPRPCSGRSPEQGIPGQREARCGWPAWAHR